MMKKLRNALRSPSRPRILHPGYLGPAIYLVFVTVWLRLINLGYSDYQGDEIRALYRPQPGQNLSEFLLSQRKGPIQFLVTYILRAVNPNYDNEFLIRLPFALAGIFAVYFFYKLVKLHFGQKIAFYSAVFMSLNGLFVAFARIVQYQSFVILFSVLSLYFLSLSAFNKTWKIYGLYLGMCFWGLATLAHFDGIFIAPFVAYLVYKWLKNYHSPPQVQLSTNTFSLKPIKIRHLFFAFTLFLAIVSAFYIPFFLAVSESTRTYWENRISGKTESSIVTFSFYNPIFVTYLYGLLGILSFLKIRRNFLVFLWFLFPFVFMEFLVSKPGTHIYAYILPLCILISYGLEVLEDLIVKNKFLLKASIFLILFLLSNTVFVEHAREYAWENKSFFMIELPKKHRQSSFGFPYYRRWEEIGSYIKAEANNGYYLTNEKKSIANYYIPAGFKDLELENTTNISQQNIYIFYINNPQSRSDKIANRDLSYWANQYKPIKTFLNQEKTLAKIYRIQMSDWEKMKKSKN